MSQRIEAKLLVDCKNHLGEGIQWSAERQRVYWPDIFGNVLQSCDENGGAIESLELETGLTAFGFTRTGRAIASFVDGICWLDMETGEREMLYPFQPDNPKTRLNDGGLDRQGRFLVGGMDEVDTTAIAPMLSVTPEGVRAIMQGIAISNSLAFSPDGKTMYFTDTPTKKIIAYSYDTETGTPSEPRLFTKLSEGDGGPDGSTVDAEGRLWNARFGGSAVQRYLPDGTPDIRVDLPVPNVTCCAIGGRNMNRLFITTARAGMSDEALNACPTAGGLFVADIPVKGLEVGFYAD